MSEENGSVGAGGAAPAPGMEGATPASTLPPSADASIIGQEAARQPVSGVNYVDASGNFVPDWTSRLPEESRESLKNFKNVEELAKGYYQTKQAVGKKGVILPTEDSSPEEVSAYRKAMGVPAEPTGYAEAIKPNVVMPEGVEWNEDLAASYFEVAHRHNIPAAAMQELVQLDAKRQEFQNQAMLQSIQDKKQEGMMMLRQTWGGNFDRNLGLVKRAVLTVQGNPNSYGWRDPDTVRTVQRLAAMMSESKFVSADSGLPMGVSDFAQLAKDIQTNPDNPKYKAYHNGDPDVQNMVRQYLIKSTSVHR
jgi:hypothetical protein